MRKIKTQYRLVIDFLRRQVSLYFWMMLICFVLFTIFSTHLFAQNQELTQSMLKKVMNQFQGIVADGQISMIRLFFNNLEASVFGILSGFIPFLFLPALGLLSNAAVLGLVFSSSQLSVYPIWKIVAFGILPHGIFELTAVLLCYAMGISICWNITKKITGYRKRENLKELLMNCLRATILVVLPLLVVAAFIETFITEKIMTAFM